MNMLGRTTMVFFVASVFLCGAPTSSCHEKLATKNVILPEPCPAGSSRYCFCLASWYGPGFFGRTLADGETYARGGVFVANKAFPFGTLLRIVPVKNRATKGRSSIVVPVKDRGPYVPGRALDLSYEAAKHLGMIGRGVIPVAYQVLPPA